MKRIAKNGSPNITFAVFDGVGNRIDYQFDSACYGQRIKNQFEETPGLSVMLYCDTETLQYSRKDFDKWTAFMTDCGFPCYMVSDTTIEGYRKTFHKCLTIAIIASDYKNLGHFWTALTAIRYIDYNREECIPNICEAALEIKEMFPEEESFRCLMLAHFPFMGNYWDYGHTLPLSQAYKLISKEVMLSRTVYHTRCNDITSGVNSQHWLSKILLLTSKRTKKGYAQAFKLLK